MSELFEVILAAGFNPFDTSRWPQRWVCGKWEEWEAWLYIISDVAIASAYFTIPLIIISFVMMRKRKLPFLNIFWLFGAFILACGATHLIDAIIFWWPAYQLSAFLRLLTALVSWATVFALIKVLPLALKLKTNEEMYQEIERRKLIESELKLRNGELELAQRMARLGYWRWDLSTGELEGSDEFLNIIQHPKNEPLTFDMFFSNVPEDDREKVQHSISESLAAQRTYEASYRYYLGDEVIFLQAMGEVTFDIAGKPMVMFGCIQDITSIKQAEFDLEMRALDLERKNNELEMFAYAASHDLQEPLRKIRAFSDRLIDKFSDELGETGKDYLGRMDNASKRMQGLIEDLLYFSRLSRSTDGFEDADLNQIIDGVRSDLEISIEQEKVVLDVAAIPKIRAVPSQLRQLFQNLISNAIKFRKADVDPHIKITGGIVSGSEMETLVRADKSAEYLRISVKDNGIGFDQKYADKIFVLFQRLHGRNDYKGTGIGLAMVKKIVENHRGFIEAKGTPGAGAEFIVYLRTDSDELT